MSACESVLERLSREGEVHISFTKDNFLFLKGITLTVFQVLGQFQIHYYLWIDC